jgi:heme-degrading monooxygenase HmoA
MGNASPINGQQPPRYAAILSTWLTGDDPEGCAEMEAEMLDLAQRQPGYRGRESLDTSDGHGLNVIYYSDEASIRAWRVHPRHHWGSW